MTGIFSKKEISLIYIAVLDENGRIISHNDFNEYGRVYNDPITAKALASDSTVVQKFQDHQTDSGALDFATPLSIGKKRWGTLKFAVSLKVLEQEVQSTIFNVIIITIMMLIVSFGVIVLLSRQFIRPITKLAQIMERAGGDKLDVKVITKRGSDEIARLEQSFNQMIDRIRDSNLEIKRTHKELLQFVGIIENADETPEAYFADQTIDQFVAGGSSTVSRLYADFSAYPDIFWFGDEGIITISGTDYKFLVKDQTSTYVDLFDDLSVSPNASDPFEIIKDNRLTKNAMNKSLFYRRVSLNSIDVQFEEAQILLKLIDKH